MSAKIISDSTMTIYHNGSVVTAHSSDSNWKLALQALRADDYDLAMALLDKPKVVEEFIRGSSLTIKGNTVFYGQHQLADSLARRILQMRAEGFDIKPMENFVVKLYRNPSYRAIAETYRFLEHNSLPITEDGDFMAYKRVRDNFMDVYTGKISNHIGAVVEMPRIDVDDNCNNTCSNGLHFASLEYLAHYSGAKLVAIKINPKDVVSIPVDYHNSKGRCCRYKVVEELSMDLIKENKDQWTKSVHVLGSNEYTEDDLDAADLDYEKELMFDQIESNRGARDAMREYLNDQGYTF